VVGINGTEVTNLVGELRDTGAVCMGEVADLRSIDETEAAFAACGSNLGPPDVAVAVAGGSGRRFGDGPIDQMTAEGWTETFALNATPVMTTARSAIAAMQGRGGSFVVVASVLAISPAPLHFETHAYAAAKGATLSLVKTLAASYAPDHIRVNAVLPAATETPMTARASRDERIQSYIARKQPLTDGMLDPDDIAGLVVFLSSDSARAITGQLIAVDGGWSVSQAT
jgi:NAD(P)-dependent dehydrogenase (short-subunit alcohol dehydrogenase family)